MNHVHNVFPPIVVANPFLRAEPTPAALPSAIAPVPAVDTSDVEDSAGDAIEVKVMWGDDVVHLTHVSEGGVFTVGDAGCDFALPADTVGGASRLPLVRGRAGRLWVVLPQGATGSVRARGQVARSVADLIAAGDATESRDCAGAREIELAAGSIARVELSGTNVTFELTHVRAAKRPAAGLLSSMKSDAHAYTGMSAFMHAALIASLAFFLPGMKGTDGETVDRDQVADMKAYLTASAEREMERNETQALNADKDQAGGSGTAAQGEGGALGTSSAPVRQTRYGVKGSPENVDPHIARERAIEEAKTFGLLSILSGSPENAPIAAWARPDALGTDPKSANGGLWGETIDDANGVGGLTLTGTGEGGGGTGEGIGLGAIGGLGYSSGDFGRGDIGNGRGGRGHGHGIVPGTYVPKGVRMQVGDTQVNGRIPAEVIQRIVRQNFGRFRLCYENALHTNPSLSGRVAVKFVIDRSGAVSLATDGGSDLPDQGVVGCVVRGFQNLSFPQPDGGLVTVTYPLVFTPGE
jgi:hypothetical protein